MYNYRNIEDTGLFPGHINLTEVSLASASEVEKPLVGGSNGVQNRACGGMEVA
jgi:hypothetical protein